MKKYAKIINENTKECQVGLGDGYDFYRSIGMTETEVEQAYNGTWYVAGYAPKKSQYLINQEKITELKQRLFETDYAVVKIAEGVSTHEAYSALLSDRQSWRAEINTLEEENEKLSKNTDCNTGYMVDVSHDA